MIQSNFQSPEEYENYLRERGIYAEGPFNALWKQAWLTYKLFTRRFSNRSYTPTQEDVHNCNLATALFAGVLPMANILWAYIQLEFIPNLILHTPRDKDARCYTDDEVIGKVFNNNQMIFEASMKGAGMSRNQYNEAVSAYQSNDQERFLRVISDLPIESFSVPCEIIDAFVAFENIIGGLGNDSAENNHRFTWLKIRDAVDDLLLSENVSDNNRFKTIASLLYGQIDKIETTDNQDIEAYQYIQWSLYLMFLIVDRMTQSLGNEESVVVCLNEILQRNEIETLRSQYLTVDFVNSASITLNSIVEEFIHSVAETLQINVSDLLDRRNLMADVTTAFIRFIDEHFNFTEDRKQHFLDSYQLKIVEFIESIKYSHAFYALNYLFYPVKTYRGKGNVDHVVYGKHLTGDLSWKTEPENSDEVVKLLLVYFPQLKKYEETGDSTKSPSKSITYLVQEVLKGKEWIKSFVTDYWNFDTRHDFMEKLKISSK